MSACPGGVEFAHRVREPLEDLIDVGLVDNQRWREHDGFDRASA